MSVDIEAANREATTRMIEARPVLVDLGRAIDTIPGMRRHIRFDGARIFFPEERWEEFNRELRSHWGEE